MATELNIINEVISLQAYFRVGLEKATGLRQRLEGKNPSVSPSGGLNADQTATLLARRERTRLKKQKAK